MGVEIIGWAKKGDNIQDAISYSESQRNRKAGKTKAEVAISQPREKVLWFPTRLNRGKNEPVAAVQSGYNGTSLTPFV